ncbi:mandelate racemase/muconate lactonizing enzyme family protein [Chloroflexota bacterium]
MKITNIETYVLEWPPFTKPFITAIDTIIETSELVVKIYTDSGIVGIGESHGSQLIAGPVTVIDKGLKPMLIGEDPLNNEYLWENMFKFTYMKDWNVHGWSRPQIMAAIGALDIALWDIKGKVAAMPIYRLLGGFRKHVPCYVMGGYYQEGKTTLDLVKECEDYLKIGYRSIKIKVGGVDLAEDIQRVRAVREAVGKDVDIMLDANEGYDIQTAIRAAQAYEDFDIYWFEEPVHWYDNVYGLSQVAASTRIPIASGEHLYTRYEARDLIARGGIKVMQFDCTRSAGPTEWLKVAGMTAMHNILMAPHHDPQIHGHLVAAVANGLILETFPDPIRDPIWGELFKVRPEIKNGEMELLELPGWGIELDEKVMDKRAVKI